MGTKIGIILVDEEDTKENLIGGKQKKCRCIAKVTRTHQAIQVAAIRTRLKPERILALDDVACITQRIVGIINMQSEMTEVMHLETSFCL